MLTIEFVVLRDGHKEVVERMASAADRLAYADQTAKALLDEVRRRHPNTPPDGFQIIAEDGVVVLRSWERLRPTERKSVLVIEDNHLTMALLRTVLQSEGYEVAEAVTAQAGLEAARRLHPDLIVMDIKLPDLSGFDATRRLKSDAATRSVPVLITSAYGADADKKRLRDCGADGYMPAPIDVSGFLDLIRSLIGSRSRLP